MDDKGKLQSVLNDLYGKNMDTLRNGVSTLLFLRYLFAEYEREARQYIGPEYDDCAREAKASRAAISPLAVWYERHGEDGSPRTFENWMRRNGNRCVVSPQISWERLVSVAKNDDSVCGFLKMAVDNIHHLNWLSAAVSWDRIGGGVLKRLVMAIDDDCPNGHGVEHCF